MLKKLVLITSLTAVFAGCASVPMENKDKSSKAKEFNLPSEGSAGLYIYRDGGPGTALKKDVFVNGDCVGETAPNVFFYHEVKGGGQHTISTESEFSPNDLLVETESGQNYFIEQYIKIGVFVGGADVKLVDEDEGKKDIEDLDLAIKGKCDSQYTKPQDEVKETASIN